MKTLEAVWTKKTDADILNIKGKMYGGLLIRDFVSGEYVLVSQEEYMKRMQLNYGFPEEFLDLLRQFEIHKIVPAVPITLDAEGRGLKKGTFDGEGYELSIFDRLDISCNLKDIKISSWEGRPRKSYMVDCIITTYGWDMHSEIWENVDIDVAGLEVSQKMPVLKGKCSVKCKVFSVKYHPKNNDDYYLKDKTLKDFGLTEQLLKKMGVTKFILHVATLHDTLHVPVEKDDGWKIDWHKHR